jgi:hypothetical protein
MRESQQMGVFQQPAREDDLRSASRRRDPNPDIEIEGCFPREI